MPAALAGSWRISFGPLEATYLFNPAFTLTSSAVEGLAPRGQASGTWKLDGARLMMTNTASNTPHTVVGEQEEAEIVGVDDQQLALRTTTRKGAEEVLVLQKVVPFEKGKHDNPKIIGTWQAENLLLVVAESGLVVLSAGGQSMKGEWSQRGDQLLVLFDVPPPPARSRRVEVETRMREAPLTIELANETTLVLTGPLPGRREGPMTLLRVK